MKYFAKYTFNKGVNMIYTIDIFRRGRIVYAVQERQHSKDIVCVWKIKPKDGINIPFGINHNQRFPLFERV